MLIVDKCPSPKILARLKNKVADSKMDIKWPNLVVDARYKSLEKVVPESSFAILTVKSEGEVTITLNGRKFRICEQGLCIINPYETFAYKIDVLEAVNIVNLHLSLDTYRELLSGLLVNNDDKLLASPLVNHESHLFLNHLYFNKPVFQHRLHQYKNSSWEDYLVGVFEVLFQIAEDDKFRLAAVPSTKSATKLELMKRVAIGRDMIYGRYDDPALTLEELSMEVSMSKFHFIRVFKQVYGYTPHKLIQQIRIKKALEYLKHPEWSLSDIAIKVGFQESNSIYPLLRLHRVHSN